MNHKVLFISRAISPPWQEGSKNQVRQLAENLKDYSIYILSKINCRHRWPNNVHPLQIYSSEALTKRQKIRLFCHLLFNLPPKDTTIAHFFFVPHLGTSFLLKLWSKFHKLKTIQSCPGILERELKDINSLLFADMVLVNSNWLKTKIEKSSGKKICYIPPGIDTDIFSPKKYSKELRDQLGVDDNIMIIYAGEFTRLNSWNILEKLLPKILSEHQDAHFICACRILRDDDKKFMLNLKNKFSSQEIFNRIHWITSSQNMSALLASADLHIYPVETMADKMSLPLVLLETMASGTPVIVSDIDSLPEIVQHGGGEVVELNDYNGWFKKVEEIISNRDKLKKLGVQARESVIKHFSKEIHIKEYSRNYNLLLRDN